MPLDTATVLAVLSLVAAAASAMAAFRPAGSAREALDAARASEKRSALRQLTVTASEVLVEAPEVKQWHETLSSFSGGFGSSRLGLHKAEVDKKLAQALHRSRRIMTSDCP